MRHASGWRPRPEIGLLAALLAACPSSAPPAARPPTAGPSPTATPASALTIAVPHEPATLNPFVRGGDAPPTRDLTRLLMPGLYRLGPGGERERWLLAAEPVEEPGPPFAVTLSLREDAVWSDGRPITADDLRFTWRTIMDERSAIASRDGYDRLADVEVLAPKRARLVFGPRFERWRDLFSAGLGVLPEHALRGRDFTRALARSWPVSGGPFVLRSWTPGLSMVLERNERAWGGAPALDRLTVAFVPDSLSALRLLRRGEVDALGPYQTVDFSRRAGEVPGAAVTSDIGATGAALLLNTRAPPLSDVRVRRALTLAIDAARIRLALVRGEGDSGPDAALHRFDLERARSLLEEAGWRGEGIRRRAGRDLEFTLAAVGDRLPEVVLRAVQLQARRAGIRVELVTLEPRRLWRTWLRSSRFEAALVIGRDPPGGSLRARFGGGSPANVTGLADERLDALLDRADRGDAAAARAARDRLQMLVPLVPLYRARVALAARGVAGMRASASADGPFWNAHEWSLR